MASAMESETAMATAMATATAETETETATATATIVKTISCSEVYNWLNLYTQFPEFMPVNGTIYACTKEASNLVSRGTYVLYNLSTCVTSVEEFLCYVPPPPSSNPNSPAPRETGEFMFTDSTHDDDQIRDLAAAALAAAATAKSVAAVSTDENELARVREAARNSARAYATARKKQNCPPSEFAYYRINK